MKNSSGQASVFFGEKKTIRCDKKGKNLIPQPLCILIRPNCVLPFCRCATAAAVLLHRFCCSGPAAAVLILRFCRYNTAAGTCCCALTGAFCRCHTVPPCDVSKFRSSSRTRRSRLNFGEMLSMGLESNLRSHFAVAIKRFGTRKL